MVFAIGWSSVSVASVKIMHINMQTSMSADNCLDKAKPMTLHSNTHDISMSNDCHDSFAFDTNLNAKDCQECASFSCQSPIFGLDLEHTSLHVPNTVYRLDRPHFTYSHQYLHGYWQEILRPPKT